MNIPNTLTAGDSWAWDDDAQWLNGVKVDSASYTLTYLLRGASAVDIASTANGSGWAVSMDATATAGLGAGMYVWVAVLTASGERFTIRRGQVSILPNLELQATPFDGRTFAEIALADAEAALHDFYNSSSKGGVRKYRINGRETEFFDMDQILEIIAYWKIRVRNERIAAAKAKGLPDPTTKLACFR